MRADLYSRRGVRETWSEELGMGVHNNLFRALLLRTTAVGPGPVAVKYAWVFYAAETAVIMSSPVLANERRCALTKLFFASHRSLVDLTFSPMSLFGGALYYARANSNARERESEISTIDINVGSTSATEDQRMCSSWNRFENSPALFYRTMRSRTNYVGELEEGALQNYLYEFVIGSI